MATRKEPMVLMSSMVCSCRTGAISSTPESMTPALLISVATPPGATAATLAAKALTLASEVTSSRKACSFRFSLLACPKGGKNRQEKKKTRKKGRRKRKNGRKKRRKEENKEERKEEGKGRRKKIKNKDTKRK